MAINYNNDIIVTKNSSKKAMECLENFVIKVNVMFSGAMAASINLNLNSVFKILIPCNYCSLAAGGGSSVRAPLLHALSSGQGILSSLLSPSVPLFLVSCHRVTVGWVPAVPGSECLIGIVLTGSLVSSAALHRQLATF